MTYLNLLRTENKGFTLVELVVVISVIGILAMIILVAYPGYQQRSRDNVRKSDLQQVASALSAHSIQKNSFVEAASGCGANGNGNGWLNADSTDLGAALYPDSIIECLQAAKVLKLGDFIDPSDCVWDSGGACGSWNGQTQAYMKATCTNSGTKTTYLFAHVEAMPRIDATIDALCDANTVSGFTSDGQKWGSHYGMNYYVIVK